MECSRKCRKPREWEIKTPPLRVGAALPDPPFEFMTGAGPTEYDVTSCSVSLHERGRTWHPGPLHG